MSIMQSDIRMLVKVERSPYAGAGSAWADDYFYVIGKPVKMKWENGESMPYGSFYTHEGDPNYDRLQVHAQGNLNDGKLYGFSVGYHDITQVTLHDVERMLKVLRPVNRKLEKMEAELGYVGDDFPSYLARAGKALGISQYGFLPIEGSTFGNGYHYQWWDAKMLDYMIAQRIKALRERAGVEVTA